MFKDSSQYFDEHMDIATSCINFFEESLIPTKTVTIYGNSKLWYCKEVYEQFKRKNAAYTVDEMEFKRVKYAVTSLILSLATWVLLFDGKPVSL